MLARSIYAVFLVTLAIFATSSSSFTVEPAYSALLDHRFANLMDEPISLCQFSGKVL